MNVLRQSHRYTQDEWRFLHDLAARRRKQGLPPPVAVANQMIVAEEHEDLWRAFVDLSGARSSGFSPDPVPCTEVEAWCSVHGVSEWRRQTFWRVVHALDMEALRMSAEKR